MYATNRRLDKKGLARDLSNYHEVGTSVIRANGLASPFHFNSLSTRFRRRLYACFPTKGKDRRGWILRATKFVLPPRDVFFPLFLFLLFFSIFPFLYGFALFNRVSLGFPFLLLLFSFFSFQRREGRSRIARMKGKTSEERTPDLSPDKSTYIYTHRYTVELLLVSKVESQEQEKNFILLFHPLFLFFNLAFHGVSKFSFPKFLFIDRNRSFLLLLFFSRLKIHEFSTNQHEGETRRFVVLRTRPGVR